jgi:hypothetical protein
MSKRTRLTSRITFRCSDTERATYQQQAKDAEQPLNQWCRIALDMFSAMNADDAAEMMAKLEGIEPESQITWEQVEQWFIDNPDAGFRVERI